MCCPVKHLAMSMKDHPLQEAPAVTEHCYLPWAFREHSDRMRKADHWQEHLEPDSDYPYWEEPREEVGWVQNPELEEVEESSTAHLVASLTRSGMGEEPPDSNCS